jgi:hypothetical protein
MMPLMPPEYFVASAVICAIIRMLVTLGYLVPDIDNDFDEDGNIIPTEEFP